MRKKTQKRPATPEQLADRYVSRQRGIGANRPATWYDVRDAYLAGHKDAQSRQGKPADGVKS